VRWGLGIGALLAVLLATGAFLAATAPGLRALAGLATVLSGGRLAFDGVAGTLAGPFDIRSLRIETATQRIVLEGLHVDWQPRALGQGLLDVDLLAARALRITATQPDTTPLELPASLRLPFDVRVRSVDLARFERTDLGGGQLQLAGLRGRLDGQGERWRLQEATAAAPWGTARGEASLGKDAPFALTGQLDVRARQPLPLRARATLAGTLAAPQFDLAADADAMHFIARGEAAPFAPVKLTRLLVAGEGIDPRRLAADAPAAALAFSGLFEGRAGERVFGSFSLVNTLPGRFDQQRLPLVQFTGAVLGDAARAEFSSLDIDLGAAGRLGGQGTWRDGRFDLAFDGARLDLAGLHRTLAATRMAVQLRLRGDAAQQTLDGTVKESWGAGQFALTRADRVIALTEADFSGQSGRLVAHGTLTLDAARAFAANLDATNIDPARFGRFPQGRLNLRGEISGALAPSLLLNAQLELPPGTLEGRPVRGQATLRYADAHLALADVDLDLAGNRARLEGAWGKRGDALDWNVDAPALARLRLGFDGQLTSTGRLAGQPDAPDVDARAQARGLQLPGALAVEALDANLTLKAAAQGVFDGSLDARGLRWRDRTVERAHARLSGRRDAHTLAFDASLPDWRVNAALAGGLDATHTWRGELKSAEVQGAWPLRLLAPAQLVLARDRQQVRALAFSVAGGRVDVAELQRDASLLASRGSLANLPVAPWLALLASPPPVHTDLRVDGDWNVRLGSSLDGEARLARAGGDVRLTAPALALGVTRLDLSLKAAANETRLHAELDTRDAGQARLDARLPLQVEAGVPTLSRTAPLAWNARLDVPDLRIVKAFLPVGVRLDARLAANLEGGGSLAAPAVSGTLRATSLRFAMPEEGVAVEDGVLDLVLADDRVRVREGELKGQGGRIVVSGDAEWRNPRAGLTLDFEKFVATHRSDRQVTVSGTTQLAFADRRLKLTGKLVTDRARVQMPEASRPALSSDVVVAGRPPREPPVSQRFPLALDLVFGLGDDFLFQGGGLDAKLGGSLRIYTQDAVLRGEGAIQVTKGRYAAYAQTLDIERGVLRFAGPVDNPGLDVLAVRKTPTVTAGVQVRGTVQRPVVTLYSDPAMPDTEKLSWLVLGHGLDNAGQQEFVLLQVAAGALLGQAESVNFQSRLAESLGIDSFDVRAGGSENLGTAIVSVGKRLSSRATLSYEQSLDGLSQVVKVLYQLSPRVRLEAQAGEQSSFDAFYTLEYD
jgi:translocation and assembly module TamB